MSEKNIYTYVVDHGNKPPSVGAGTIINGGKLNTVMFDDALVKLEKMEEFLELLRFDTDCKDVEIAIDNFLKGNCA